MGWGFFPWLNEFFAEEGLASCRFDLSRNGIGSNPDSFERLDLFRDDTYSIQIADVLAVARHIETISEFANLPRFLLGHSRGGGVAILSAAEIRGLAGIVTWSSISHTARWDEETKRKWRDDGKLDVLNARTGQIMSLSTAVLDDVEQNASRLDIGRAASELDVPMLVIHGSSDETVPVEEAKTIVSRSRIGSLMVIESATHTMNAIHPLVTTPPPLQLAARASSRLMSTLAETVG